MQFKNFVGIDISKDSIDIALITPDGELYGYKWKNDRGTLYKSFAQFFKEHGLDLYSTLICAEHTGQYGNKLIDVAIQLELSLWMESPYTIVHSQGLTRGKNDKVDAIRIAEYAKRFVDKAVLVRPTPQSITQLKLMATERELLLKDLAKFKGQLKQEEGFLDEKYFKEKTKRMKKIIVLLEKSVSQIDKEMDDIITQDESIKKNYDIIVSIEGVGKQTAVSTIVATHNFTKFNDPRKFACHIGCAPFKYQSGSSLNSRNKVSQKANKDIKKIFHMAAISTLRSTGEMRKYYDRKVEEGKNKMSVINAIRSKLIHRIFALVKQERKYEKNYIHSLV